MDVRIIIINNKAQDIPVSGIMNILLSGGSQSFISTVKSSIVGHLSRVLDNSPNGTMMTSCSTNQRGFLMKDYVQVLTWCLSIIFDFKDPLAINVAAIPKKAPIPMITDPIPIEVRLGALSILEIKSANSSLADARQPRVVC